MKYFSTTLPVFHWCNKNSSPVISLICIKFVFKCFIIAKTLDGVTVLEDGIIIVQGGTHFVSLYKKQEKYLILLNLLSLKNYLSTVRSPSVLKTHLNGTWVRVQLPLALVTNKVKAPASDVISQNTGRYCAG